MHWIICPVPEVIVLQCASHNVRVLLALRSHELGHRHFLHDRVSLSDTRVDIRMHLVAATECLGQLADCLDGSRDGGGGRV